MIKKRLEKLSELEDGWHYDGANAIPDSVIEEAKQLADTVEREGEVFPLGEGGVQLEYFDGHDEVEIEIHPDLSKDLVRFRGGGEIETVKKIDGATEEQILNQISKIDRNA